MGRKIINMRPDFLYFCTPNNLGFTDPEFAYKHYVPRIFKRARWLVGTLTKNGNIIEIARVHNRSLAKKIAMFHNDKNVMYWQMAYPGICDPHILPYVNLRGQ